MDQGIERELRVGDMATVYLAHDIEPDHQAAIKAADFGIARDLREHSYLRVLLLGQSNPLYLRPFSV